MVVGQSNELTINHKGLLISPAKNYYIITIIILALRTIIFMDSAGGHHHHNQHELVQGQFFRIQLKLLNITRVNSKA